MDWRDLMRVSHEFGIAGAKMAAAEGVSMADVIAYMGELAGGLTIQQAIANAQRVADASAADPDMLFGVLPEERPAVTITVFGPDGSKMAEWGPPTRKADLFRRRRTSSDRAPYSFVV